MEERQKLAGRGEWGHAAAMHLFPQQRQPLGHRAVPAEQFLQPVR